ncbi:MAG: hypothetical protein Q9P01_16645 [Anaerolineae bacterium]|nr:hypothetical protein [Anaerolineae bacterium]
MMTLVTLIPADAASAMAGADEVTPALLLTIFSGLMADEETLPDGFGESQDVTIGGRAGVLATGDSDSLSMVMVVLSDESGAYLIAMGVTAGGEGDDLRPTFDAILNSVQYTPATSE